MKAKGFNIDLHVHTRRYSPCAETLDPYKLGKAMRRRNIQGVVITEHDLFWEPAELKELNKALGEDLCLYRGVESSSKDGHLLIIGINNLDGIRPHLPAEDTIEKALQKEAAVVLAHPCYPHCEYCMEEPLPEWMKKVHALEVASSLTIGALETRTKMLACQTGLIKVAGSDAHCLSNVGEAYTSFPRKPMDEADLAQMIRDGVGTPKRNFTKYAD